MGKTSSKPSVGGVASPSLEGAINNSKQTNETNDEELEISKDNKLLESLRSLKLPEAPSTSEVNPQNAALRRSRIIRGCPEGRDIQLPRRVCIYLCYSEKYSRLEASTIRQHANKRVREWCQAQFEIPVDFIDLHEGLLQNPVSSSEMEALHLKMICNMASSEVLPVFVRIASSPGKAGTIVIPDSLSTHDLTRIDNPESVSKYYVSNKNRIASDPNTLWLDPEASADDRHTIAHELSTSLFGSQMQLVEEKVLSLATSSLNSASFVHLHMTEVQVDDDQSPYASLTKLDETMRAATPVSQTAMWNRPPYIPFNATDIDFGHSLSDSDDIRAYCLAVCKSYAMSVAYAIIGQLACLNMADTTLFIEMQSHLAFLANKNEAKATSSEGLQMLIPAKLVKQYILLEKTAPPLIIHAPPGGGRTTAALDIAHLAAELPTKSHTQRVIVTRFGGLTERSSNLYTFLHDLNRHLCMVYDGNSKHQPSSEKDLVRGWHNVLSLASPYLPVVIVLDIDSDMLKSPLQESPKLANSPLQWLPATLPPSVRLIVVTSTVEAEKLQTRIPPAMIQPLVSQINEISENILDAQLNLRSCKLTLEQRKSLFARLPEGRILPITPSLWALCATHWNHEYQPATPKPTIEVDVSEPLAVLEAHHGHTVVETALLALCICYEGCSDVELSLLLQAARVQMPMRAWMLLRADLGNFIHYHSAHHINALSSTLLRHHICNHYSKAAWNRVVRLLIKTFQGLVGDGCATNHISMELFSLLERCASQEEVIEALSEPRFLLHLIASSETANSSNISRMWAALTQKQKKRTCTAAYDVLLRMLAHVSGLKLKRIIDQAMSIALFADRMQDKELAADLFAQTLRVQEQVLGADHPLTLNMAAKVAGIFFKNANTKKALELCRTYTRAFVDPAKSKEFKPCHLEVASLFLLRSNIHLDKNEFLEAKQDLEKVLAIYHMNNQSIDVDDVRIAAVWGNLANVCGAMEEHQDALKYYEKALAVFEKSGQRDVKKLCTTQLNIALSQRSLGRFEDALKSAERAGDIASNVWNEHHQLALESVYSRAITYELMGKFADALELYREASEGYVTLSGRMSHTMAAAIRRCKEKVSS